MFCHLPDCIAMDHRSHATSQASIQGRAVHRISEWPAEDKELLRSLKVIYLHNRENTFPHVLLQKKRTVHYSSNGRQNIFQIKC